MIRRPPRSTQSRSSAASDVYKRQVPGSGNGSDGWFSLRTATVYYGHPVHTPAWHTLNIDFANPAEGPSARVAVETHSAVRPALVDAIRAALAAVPPELTTERSTAAR